MTQFIPKEMDPQSNVNVSQVSQGKEFFVLLGGLLAIVLGIYIILGFAVDIIINTMPEKVENILTSVIDSDFYDTPGGYAEAEKYLQRLVDDLRQYLPEDSRRYTVHIVDDEAVNALAFPGGHILIFSGLLKQVESENELVMVLGHEMGHFKNKDHLKGFGRGLVLTVLSAVVLGANSEVTSFINGLLTTADLKFSRDQELRADEFGLGLLNKKYGHVSGATDFFERLQKDEFMPQWTAFMSTHPVSKKRVDEINKIILENKFNVLKERTPADQVLLRESVLE